MDKRQFLAGAALIAATPALAQPQMQKPGTDELGRTLGSMQAKADPAPQGAHHRTVPDAALLAQRHHRRPEGRGFWVQQQRHDRGPESAWLLDRKGKVLHSVVTECVDCSGMAVGNGFVWSGANGASVHNPPDPPVEGVFQTDMNAKTVSHHQIPFGPKNNGGSCHGLAWENADGGRLWIQSNRLEALVRMNPDELGMRLHVPRRPGGPAARHRGGRRLHLAGLWHPGPQDAGLCRLHAGLVKYDIKTGEPVEFVDFVPGSCDMHDVCVLDGQLYGVDAGEHPGWPINDKYARPGFPPLNSPSGGYVFKIDRDLRH